MYYFATKRSVLVGENTVIHRSAFPIRENASTPHTARTEINVHTNKINDFRTYNSPCPPTFQSFQPNDPISMVTPIVRVNPHTPISPISHQNPKKENNIFLSKITFMSVCNESSMGNVLSIKCDKEEHSFDTVSSQESYEKISALFTAKKKNQIPSSSIEKSREKGSGERYCIILPNSELLWSWLLFSIKVPKENILSSTHESEKMENRKKNYFDSDCSLEKRNLTSDGYFSDEKDNFKNKNSDFPKKKNEREIKIRMKEKKYDDEFIYNINCKRKEDNLKLAGEMEEESGEDDIEYSSLLLSHKLNNETHSHSPSHSSLLPRCSYPHNDDNNYGIKNNNDNNNSNCHNDNNNVFFSPSSSSKYGPRFSKLLKLHDTFLCPVQFKSDRCLLAFLFIISMIIIIIIIAITMLRYSY